jgi:hypothetical protein
VVAAFVLLVDGLPLLFFLADVLSTTFDASLQIQRPLNSTAELNSTVEQSALMAVHVKHGASVPSIAFLLFMYKLLVMLWYAVFEFKANWGNEEQESWVPADDRRFCAVWCSLALHTILTASSAMSGINTLGSVPSNGTYCVGVAHPDALAADTFRCASPTDMLAIDAVFYLGVAIMFMLLAGEGVNKTRGDADRTWPDSWTAKIAENSLQLLLTGQVLYSMLRLRTQSDPLYVLFCMLDLVWIFALMLSRQFREGYGDVTWKDWGLMYVLESWDVVSCLIVTVAIARDTENDWPTSIADTYVVFFILTLSLFQATYPFWTSLKRIAFFSCFNDVVTDGPMLYLMLVHKLYDKSIVTAIAAFVNICIIAVGVVIWPLKHYIREALEEDVVEEGVPAP